MERTARRLARRILQTCALAGTLVAAPLGAQEVAGAPGSEPEFGTLRVLVYDGTPCLPIVGVPLVLAEPGAVAATDARGVAVFETVRAGVYTLEVTVAGREPRARRIVIEGGETVQVAIDVARREF